MTPRHVIVVGSGVVGLSCAQALQERGCRVTVVERGGSDRDSCSLGNAGYVSPSHVYPLASPGIVQKALGWLGDPESPFYVHPRLDPHFLSWAWRFWRAATPERARAAGPTILELTMRSRELFVRMAERSGNEFALVTEGSLNLVRTERGLEEEARVAARARELGQPAHVLDAKGVAALEPDLTLDIVGGVYYPLDAHVTPQLFVKTLERWVAEAGARFVWNAELTGWRTERGRVRAARTALGELEADAFVIAAGSWSGLLARGLGVRLPMEPGKGYSMTMTRPRERIRRSVLLHEARVALTPMGTTLRVGGTMELTGHDLSISPPRLRGIQKSLRQYLPAFGDADFAGVTPWCGLRPCTPDGLPYVGRTSRYENLGVAAGHAMMGLSMAPATGRLLAQLLLDEPPDFDPALLRPDRYA
ncbi:MAG TPA: FAD-dependent oxidoreductase [Candidatus Eisenbacteria bacterium]|nr:FAD-dependent oxidoreductase [Candidatus Eisenbacteria bacterium]